MVVVGWCEAYSLGIRCKQVPETGEIDIAATDDHTDSVATEIHAALKHCCCGETTCWFNNWTLQCSCSQRTKVLQRSAHDRDAGAGELGSKQVNVECKDVGTLALLQPTDEPSKLRRTRVEIAGLPS
jgi:hypothetical protein